MQNCDSNNMEKPVSELVRPLWFDGFKQSGVALFRKTFSKDYLLDLRNEFLKSNDLSKISSEGVGYIPLKNSAVHEVDSFHVHRKMFPIMNIFFPRRYFMMTSNCILIRMPNSECDAVHPGHPDLFGWNVNITNQLPHFEITVCTPLNELGLSYPGLRVWTGYHLMPYSDRQQIVGETPGFYDCSADLGDSFLLDARLPIQYPMHVGPNPCMTLLTRYSVPWFRNVDTKSKLPRLTVTADEFGSIDPDLQFLFDHATGRRDWRHFPFTLLAASTDTNGAAKSVS